MAALVWARAITTYPAPPSTDALLLRAGSTFQLSTVNRPISTSFQRLPASIVDRQLGCDWPSRNGACGWPFWMRCRLRRGKPGGARSPAGSGASPAPLSELQLLCGKVRESPVFQRLPPPIVYLQLRDPVLAGGAQTVCVNPAAPPDSL